ncbi:hypothetical protein [Tateyamaria sp. SN3-11]|uniref:hypothetical protein n=1 Tax=Tateyamaria sp. SN3-11 TaxID=3092147 RepID=UPI0039E7BB33
MTTEHATYRYFKVFIPAILVYAIGSVGLSWAGNSIPMPQYALYCVAIVPIAAMFVIFWAHWRFATEIDEFMRLIQIKATLVGVVCIMVVASGWGTLEMLADAPRLPVFWLFPLFWVAHSAATAILSQKEGMF